MTRTKPPFPRSQPRTTIKIPKRYRGGGLAERAYQDGYVAGLADRLCKSIADTAVATLAGRLADTFGTGAAGALPFILPELAPEIARASVEPDLEPEPSSSPADLSIPPLYCPDDGAPTWPLVEFRGAVFACEKCGRQFDRRNPPAPPAPSSSPARHRYEDGPGDVSPADCEALAGICAADPSDNSASRKGAAADWNHGADALPDPSSRPGEGVAVHPDELRAAAAPTEPDDPIGGAIEGLIRLVAGAAILAGEEVTITENDGEPVFYNPTPATIVSEALKRPGLRALARECSRARWDRALRKRNMTCRICGDELRAAAVPTSGEAAIVATGGKLSPATVRALESLRPKERAIVDRRLDGSRLAADAAARADAAFAATPAGEAFDAYTRRQRRAPGLRALARECSRARWDRALRKRNMKCRICGGELRAGVDGWPCSKCGTTAGRPRPSKIPVEIDGTRHEPAFRSGYGAGFNFGTREGYKLADASPADNRRAFRLGVRAGAAARAIASAKGGAK